MKNRDTFIFYRSFYESAKELPEEERLKFYEYVMEYSLDFKDPDIGGLAGAFFTLIKPVLSKANTQFVNGSKPKRSQKEANPKPSNKPNANNKDKDKDKDKDKKKKTDRELIYEAKPSYFSLEQWDELYTHRVKRGATQTARAYKNIIIEFDKAVDGGMDAEKILDAMSAGKGWAGFKYEWVLNKSGDKSVSRRRNTLDEFTDMIGDLNERNNGNRGTTEGNSIEAVGALGLPLP